MAEHVFKNLEGMIPELEDLERNGIFSRDELRIIIKKRTDMEYKLQRRVVEKEDFLKYLQYEMNVDSLRKKRIQKLAIKKKHSAAEIGISKRMHYIFQKALKKFGDDLKLWMQYIDFCKQTGSSASLGRAFGRLMQLHPHNPSIWIMASKYEFEDNGNVDNARALMQNSLRLNSKSKTLWLEYFRLELLHVDKMKKRRNILSLSTEGDQLECGEISESFFTNKTASIVFEKAVLEFPDDVEFRLSFLPIYRLFQGTESNQNEVYDSLTKDFPNHEKFLDALAKRPIEDLVYSRLDEKQIEDDEWCKAEALSCKLYEEFAEKRDDGKIYECYLETFLQLLKQSDSTEQQVSRRLKTILNILKLADDNNCVSEQMFHVWSELLLNIGDESGALEVLTKSVEKLQTVCLYERYLHMRIDNCDDWEALNEEFEKLLSNIDEKESLPIWQLWIETCVDQQPNSARKIFEKSLSSTREVAEFGRLEYLNWTYKKDGMKGARKLYKRLRLDTPMTLKFVKAAIDLESQQESPRTKRIRSLYESALDDFGEESTDIWLDFISFELKQNDTALDNAGPLYWKALKTLDSKYVADFVDAYTILQARNRTV